MYIRVIDKWEVKQYIIYDIEMVKLSENGKFCHSCIQIYAIEI